MCDNKLKFAFETKEGTVLNIQLTPNSSKNEILGYNEDFIKIKVTAPPNENKANKKLIEFLSGEFNIAKSNISFISGEKSRIKKILIKKTDCGNLIKKIFVYDKL